MTIDEIKQAMVAAKMVCENVHCNQCPFLKGLKAFPSIKTCPLSNKDGVNCPKDWSVDEWEEHDPSECRYANYDIRTETLRCFATPERDQCEGRKCKLWTAKEETNGL